eukprot:GHVU01165261.1.p1 GENE.GHVU01165261.1~~GHVU01165261.1.p1  ORF type:complete len:718 (+),score=70.97 GHVU01165261.1:180-2333(+)
MMNSAGYGWSRSVRGVHGTVVSDTWEPQIGIRGSRHGPCRMAMEPPLLRTRLGMFFWGVLVVVTIVAGVAHIGFKPGVVAFPVNHASRLRRNLMFEHAWRPGRRSRDWRSREYPRTYRSCGSPLQTRGRQGTYRHPKDGESMEFISGVSANRLPEGGAINPTSSRERWRREQLRKYTLRFGNPYEDDFNRTSSLATLTGRHSGLPPGARTDDRVRVAGRIMSFRNKNHFVDISDSTSAVQVYISTGSGLPGGSLLAGAEDPADRLGDGPDLHAAGVSESTLSSALASTECTPAAPKVAAQVLPLLDLGDVVGVEGLVRRTPRGSLTVDATSLQLLAKCLHDVPLGAGGANRVLKATGESPPDGTVGGSVSRGSDGGPWEGDTPAGNAAARQPGEEADSPRGAHPGKPSAVESRPDAPATDAAGMVVPVGSIEFSSRSPETAVPAGRVVESSSSLSACTRRRDPCLSLIADADSKTRLLNRFHFIKKLRQYLDNRGFLEVDTPTLLQSPMGAEATPFVTRHHDLKVPLYLRVAPELHLKQLLVGGIANQIYEIGKAFRNEGSSSWHNCEFTMMEAYAGYSTLEETMELVEDVVGLCQQVTNANTAPAKLPSDNAAWERLDMLSLILQFSGADFSRMNGVEARDCARRMGVTFPWGEGPDVGQDDPDHTASAELWGQAVEEVFERIVVPRLPPRAHVLHHPLVLSPLSRAWKKETPRMW